MTAALGLCGLTLIAQNGTEWRWLGTDSVVNRRGATVQVDRFAGACRVCGASFPVAVKMPPELRERFYKRRLAQGAGEIRMVVVPSMQSRSFRSFALRNCRTHRGWGAPVGMTCDLA